jgi:hypothetical protein
MTITNAWSDKEDMNMKREIKEFALDIGVDDVGVCSIEEYKSPRSPAINTLFPAARSIVVLAFGELSGCEGGNPYIAMNERLDLGAFSRACSYRLARFIEKKLRGSASTASNFRPQKGSHRRTFTQACGGGGRPRYVRPPQSRHPSRDGKQGDLWRSSH